jgi:hypothetical protein
LVLVQWNHDIRRQALAFDDNESVVLNAIEFRVNLEDGGVDYTTPLWDTLHEFLPQKSMVGIGSMES